MLLTNIMLPFLAHSKSAFFLTNSIVFLDLAHPIILLNHTTVCPLITQEASTSDSPAVVGAVVVFIPMGIQKNLYNINIAIFGEGF